MSSTVLWKSSKLLQIDSYATDQELVHSYIKDGKIIIALTDGYRSWQESIPLPENWKK